MLKYCLLILVYCLLFTDNCIAQCGNNLVPNPSFEVYSKCPDNAGQVNYATGWTNPTAASPDYYNACNSMPGMSVPYSGGVFQYAKTGNAYVGLFAFSVSAPLANVREYVQTQLLNPLVSGKNIVCPFLLALTITLYIR